MTGNPTIRQIKISCPECEQKLDVSQIIPFTEVSCPKCLARIMVPLRFSHYLLEEPLAEGEYASVYRATDLKLDRPVAIKIFSTAISAMPQVVGQLIGQTKKMAVINHPSILSIFSNGEHQGQYYIAMEFMSQLSLCHKVRDQQPLPVESCLNYIIQAGRGLAAAYREGMTHGGVKPTNLLLDGVDNLKVSDFGMWPNFSEKQDEGLERMLLDREPRYTCPEILRTGIGDYRSDLFSLGACLYFALTGEPPFSTQRQELESAEDAELVAGEPIEQRPDISPELNNLTLQLLDPLPEKRPAGYEQLLTRLEHIARNLSSRGWARGGGQTVEKKAGRRSGTGGRGGPGTDYLYAHYRKLRRRRRAKTAGLTASLLLVVMLLLLLTGQSMESSWYRRNILPLLDRARNAWFTAFDLPVDESRGNRGIADPPPLVVPYPDKDEVSPLSLPEPGVAEEEAVEAPEKKDPKEPGVIGDGLNIPLVDFRPRPADLNLQSVQEQLREYLGRHPAAWLRELERERIVKLSRLRGYLMQLMRSPYDATESGILLASGRRVYGVIPFCNEDELTIRLSRPEASLRVLKWENLDFTQYLDFFQYYIDRRLDFIDAPQNQMLGLDPESDSAVDYFRMALLADWYGYYAQARHYAEQSLRLEPAMQPEIERFLYYLEL